MAQQNIAVKDRHAAPAATQTERDLMLERYRAMIEEASDIIMLYENGRVVCASAALGRLLGRKPEEFKNGRYVETVHPDDLAEAQKVRGQPGPGEIWTATYRVRHADGHYIWFEVTTRGVYDGAGRFLREISVGRDVTLRKEHEMKMRAAQEHAEAANRAKSLFLANMSHELRTPLNAVIGFSDIMRQRLFGALGDERYQDYAEQIHESGNRLLAMISDILDMARLEAGLLEMHFEQINLADLIEDCVRGVREDAQARGLALVAETQSGVSLMADRRAVKQIALHLLSNAMKFTASGGHVSIAARESAGSTALIVRDDGIGIPPSEVSRLGRPFEQVCADPRLAKNGAGLGLALVRALAEKHGGSMSIASEPGVGTTVTVEFPAEPAQAVA